MGPQSEFDLRPSEVNFAGLRRLPRRPICDGAPFVADREIYSSSEVSSRRVTFRFSSSNCLSSTKSGQLVMGSEAF